MGIVSGIPKWNWKRIRRLSVGLFALSAVVLLIAAWWMGGVLIAPAPQTVGLPPDDLPIQSTVLDSDSGAAIATWFAAPDNPFATVLLVHPLRGSRLSMIERARILFSQGFAVVLIDLQAHGESTGEVITAGGLERHDVKAALEFARNRYPEIKIGVVGWSLGGAAALLAEPEIDALVLESVYPTIQKAVRQRLEIKCGPLSHLMTPLLIMQMRPRLGISANELRPIDHLCNLECPIMILAGSQDRRTTLEDSKAMADSAGDAVELVIFEGAAHQDLRQFDRQKYDDRVLEFLRQHLSDPDRRE